ncbi:phosphomannomutase CpsG [Vibrio ostreicida]|uniref:phosphomannomutase n=1 Tax=Vibrio ostreicida TaxID=526588 RepID=A0ABT8BMV7_9VIBR|nr:phosphomannomutase CpsG [Vibrio ostreicida]MDN3608471.1 phosphomannomutase CpsG [Vibrio ostreicida]NPD10293.1 phosphomannomutase CpsG [Vibrio ostreicida]
MAILTCFKAYDVRGKLGTELNSDVAYRIGRAFGVHLSLPDDKLKTVVIGGDIRLSSNELKQALISGLLDSGVNVIDIGVTGTEEVYFATHFLQLDGGVEVTASHNPIDYNGMKFVRERAQPISGDSGLNEIKHLAEENDFPKNKLRGSLTKKSNLSSYTDHLMSYISPGNIRPMKLVVNSGNGSAGHVIDSIEERFKLLSVPIEFIKIHHKADGNFPNGIPNPLLPERRADTAQAVIKYKADMGIAWDGDFDRCFFFDENGEFVEGYYIVGLLAEAFLRKKKGEKIIHDPRLIWNTIDVVKEGGGIPIMSKTGHAFIKERMRREDAIYGGEMSAHHYFRDFAYCDSGMIPWLLVAEIISINRAKLSDTVKHRMACYPSSGEINRKVENPDSVIKKVLRLYSVQAFEIDHTDGVSMDMGEWRFNLRKSNTEPLIRLNVEVKGNSELLKLKVQEILDLLS